MPAGCQLVLLLSLSEAPFLPSPRKMGVIKGLMVVLWGQTVDVRKAHSMSPAHAFSLSLSIPLPFSSCSGSSQAQAHEWQPQRPGLGLHRAAGGEEPGLAQGQHAHHILGTMQ